MKVHSNIPMRNNDAKAIKEVRRALFAHGRSEPELSYPALLEDEKTLFSAGMLGMCLLLAGLMFVASCMHSTVAHAYTDEQAIKTIVGEASNQGFIGMVAVAEVIRHKGSLRGFYGLRASHSAHEPRWVWNMAETAWLASKTTNYTKYADHFENIHTFGVPYWVKNCVLTFVYRDHKFYKEIS